MQGPLRYDQGRRQCRDPPRPRPQRLSPSRACVPLSQLGCRGSCTARGYPSSPGQGVRQPSGAWEGGRGRRRDWGCAPQTKAPTGPRRRLPATSVATLTSAGSRLRSSVAARRPRPDPLRCAPLLEAWAGRGGRPPRCPGPRARVRERVRGAQQLRRASPAHAPPALLTPPT